MGLSRQAAVAGAIREQKLLRQREAYLAAAHDVLAERLQLQHCAQVSERREAAAEEAVLRRRVRELRRQFSPRLEERRRKLKALLDSEQAQAEAALQQLQGTAAAREKVIMERATALKQKHDQERDKEDERLLTLRMKQERGDLRAQEYKELVQEMLAANAMQIACKKKQQEELAKEEKVFHALWTEGLNEKRLRERRAINANIKKAEQTKSVLLEQIAKRKEQRQEELERLRIENEEEIRRLDEEAQAAAEQRRQQQAAAVQRRKEMDRALAEQLEERDRRRLEDAELEREQLAEEERKELERAEADAARRQRERAAAAECREQVKKLEEHKAALESQKAVERAQVTEAVEQYKELLRQERVARLKAMQAYRNALDDQIEQRRRLKDASKELDSETKNIFGGGE
ncbi:hypothetical protein, conserved [Eimeria brunetti]|uniref:Trichohyalin-plectin-homology domain-containing protein n=1 Tax=Eimeria brunetti TaxID=51314 RepID=U6LYK4_9EIME|nr:hypothetical protein, conserved [Eimeria brunetti]